MRMEKKELNSWKEISTYLNIDISTCRRWAKAKGLPVKCRHDGPKAPVFAPINELKQWLRERPPFTEKNQKPLLKKSKSRLSGNHAIWLFSSMILTGIILFAFVKRDTNMEPVDFRFEKSFLVIVDYLGRDLWRYDTRLTDINPEEYRSRFQFIPTDSSPMKSAYLVISDLDQDGSKEILFSTQNRDDFLGEGHLICFGFDGKVKWEIKTGHEMSFGGEHYAGDYRVGGILVEDIDNDGLREIFVFSNHYPYFPAQLLILDVNGNQIGEFWNSGHIAGISFYDPDGDGSKKLLAWGVNNEYKKGFLAVFDPFKIQGVSPQIKREYACLKNGNGTELFYILIPRTDVDRQSELRESVQTVEINSSNELLVKTEKTQLYYKFSQQFIPKQLLLSDTFERMHREMRESGRIISRCDEAYRRDLENGILYWEGAKWTTRPQQISVYPSET